MRATGVPGQHRGVSQSFSKGGSLNQGAVRKTLVGGGGSRKDKPVDGNCSQFDGEGVQGHSPILVDNVEVTTSLAGKSVGVPAEVAGQSVVSAGSQASVAKDSSAGFQGDRVILGAGEELIPGQTDPLVAAGLCPPLRLSEVVIESDFRFTSGELSSGPGVGLGLEEKRVDVTKKKAGGQRYWEA
ncbi:hypothetical protein Q3G72_002547 [Acer saccharum]|nr:hypothetical protein Q3G72_002547 [Acer saccharum]